ncbi:MAG: glucose 1-dehydrogenase [Candidatus Hydrothermarchaeota archaeon]
MKAIAVNPLKKNSLRLIDVPEPDIGENEVLLKVLCVGIDGTDREISEGFYGKAPDGYDYLIIGHECLALVEEVGSKVKDFKRGDLVVPTVRRPCPERCINCRNQESDMCLTGNYLEHGIHGLHGFASEFTVSDADYLVKIPEEIKDFAVLLEPLSIAEKAIYQSFKIQERMIWNPRRTAVLGIGPLGLLLVFILRLKGIETYVLGRSPRESLRANLANKVGAIYIDTRETSKSDIGNFDLVFEATGSVSFALERLDLLNPNSVFCILGIYRELKECKDFGNLLTEIVLKNKLIFGSVNANRRYFETGIDHMLDIKERWGNLLKELITREVKPENYAEALKKYPEDIKTVIRFNL